MALREQFTNLSEFTGAVDFYYMAKSKNDIIRFSDLPKDDLESPCNVMLYEDSPSDKGLKIPADHPHPEWGGVKIKRLLLDSDEYESTADLRTEKELKFDNRHLGTSKNSGDETSTGKSYTINHDEGELKLGQSLNSEKITDDEGPVDNIRIFLNKAQLYLPEWDNYFEIDKVLNNAYRPGTQNSFTLETEKAKQACENKGRAANSKEQDRKDTCNEIKEILKDACVALDELADASIAAFNGYIEDVNAYYAARPDVCDIRGYPYQSPSMDTGTYYAGLGGYYHSGWSRPDFPPQKIFDVGQCKANIDKSYPCNNKYNPYNAETFCKDTCLGDQEPKLDNVSDFEENYLLGYCTETPESSGAVSYTCDSNSVFQQCESTKIPVRKSVEAWRVHPYSKFGDPNYKWSIKKTQSIGVTPDGDLYHNTVDVENNGQNLLRYYELIPYHIRRAAENMGTLKRDVSNYRVIDESLGPKENGRGYKTRSCKGGRFPYGWTNYYTLLKNIFEGIEGLEMRSVDVSEPGNLSYYGNSSPVYRSMWIGGVNVGFLTYYTHFTETSSRKEDVVEAYKKSNAFGVDLSSDWETKTTKRGWHFSCAATHRCKNDSGSTDNYLVINEARTDVAVDYCDCGGTAPLPLEYPGVLPMLDSVDYYDYRLEAYNQPAGIDITKAAGSSLSENVVHYKGGAWFSEAGGEGDYLQYSPIISKDQAGLRAWSADDLGDCKDHPGVTDLSCGWRVPINQS